MPQALTNVRFTYQDYLLLPEDKRYEIIEGELIMVPAPIPYHQDVSKSLFLRLNNYVESENLVNMEKKNVEVLTLKEKGFEKAGFYTKNETLPPCFKI